MADRVDQAERQLGEVLRLLRLEARMSQRDLALRVGFHENAVSSFERGERAPSAQYLTGFINVLGLPSDIADGIWRLYRQEPQATRMPSPHGGGQGPPCPYRGLSAFREADARFFHGREAAVARITGKLDASPLVAVVGASGSGKSSVVFAGVVPRLRRSADWDVVSLRPGPDPFAAFANALSPPDMGQHADAAAAVPTTAEVSTTAEASVTAALDARTRRCGAATLVVIDQFEELFTHGAAAALVDGFLTLLVQMTATRRRVPVKVVLTFRGDFYGQVIARRDFSDLLQDNVVHLPPMSRAELRQAIVEPARLVGLALDNGLVDRILDDAGTEPGNLPLLEFALTWLWDMRRGMSLTHEAYRQIAGLAGAITARAEEVYVGLSPEQQYAARQILVRLVQVARPEEDGNDARRRTPIAELAALPRVDAVIAALADARLVVTDADNTLGPTVELSHEAIIRSWERLRVWLVEDRQFLLWQQRARQWVAEWRHAAGHPDTLLRGSLLDEAQRWLAVKGRDGVASDLLDYAEASIREHEAETRRQALNRIDQLLSVVPREVPEVAATFAEESEDVHVVLRGRLGDVPAGQRWRVRVALLGTDPAQAEHLIHEVGQLWPDELIAVRDAVRPFRARLLTRLWTMATADAASAREQMFSAVLLADFAPDDERWPAFATGVAARLVNQNQLHLRVFVDGLRPVREWLLQPLLDIFADTTELRAASQATTAAILLDLAADQPELLARMVVHARSQNFGQVLDALQDVLTPMAIEVLHTAAHTAPAEEQTETQRVWTGRRRATALCALLRLGARPNLDDLCAPTPDPELLTQFTVHAQRLLVPATDLTGLLATVTGSRAKYTLLLALGQYPPPDPAASLAPAIPALVADLQGDNDPGVRTAAVWLLRRWEASGQPPPTAPYDPTGRRGWFTVDTGQESTTFVVLRPGHVLLGSPDDEADRSDYESPRQPTTLTRSYALCEREVTRAEFERFMAATNTHGLPNIDEWSPLGVEPVVAPTWFEATAYADWLSTQVIGAGASPQDQQDTQRSRLRLPTEAEWEYACRAGTTTAYSFGSDRDLLGQFGWYADNSGLKTHEAGLLRPNPAGLFNIHGQCWEWCQDWYGPYSDQPRVDPTGPDDGDRKVLRGGCWNLGPRYARSACRNAHIPSNRNYYITFRLAITIPEIDPHWTPDQPNPLPWTG